MKMVLKIEKDVMFRLLQQRCNIHECKFIPDRNFNSFSIVHCSKEVKFQPAITDGILKVSINHLYGMHNPSLLFDLFEILTELNLKCSFCIAEDTLMLLNQKVETPKKFSNEMFQLFTKKCDKLTLNLKEANKAALFKFQLNYDGCLVINKCLKLSAEFLEAILEMDALELVISLSNVYLHCFSKAPICSKMLSIAEDANVHDFQPFSYLYIMKNKKYFIESVKLLYPCVDNVENIYLDKSFMEIMPIHLIEDYRYAPNLLTDWLRTLKNGILGGEENIAKSLKKGIFDIEYVYSSKRVALEKEDDVLQAIIIDVFNQIEKSDGICLILEKSVIDILSISGAEYDIDNSQQYILQFLKTIDEMQENPCLIDLKFYVTSKGSIIFNDYCEMWPSVLIKVKKSIALLLNAIKCFSDTMTGINSINEKIDELAGSIDEDDKTKSFWYRSEKSLKIKNRFLSVAQDENEDENRHDFTRKKCWELFKKSGNFLINVAKLFNPLLSNIPSCFFKIKNFCCIPPAVFLWKQQLQSQLLDSLREIRRNHISVIADPSEFNKFRVSYIECDLLFIYCFGKYIDDLKKFLDIMEDIIAEIGSSVKINALTNTLLTMEEENVECDKAWNLKLLEKCLEKIICLNKTICIDNDEDDIHSWLSFDWYLEIRCDVFLKIQSYQKFFAALEIYRDLHNTIDSYCPDQWINFGTIENKNLKDNFLEIAKILYPIINQIKDQSLLSCINILPENIIPSPKIIHPNNDNIDQGWKEKAYERLKFNLKSLHERNCILYLLSSGEISTKFYKCETLHDGELQPSKWLIPVEIPPSKWLQIKNFKAFEDMYKTMCDLCSRYDYSLFSSGCLHTYDEKKNTRRAYSQESKKVHQTLVKDVLHDISFAASYYFYMISTADAEKKVKIPLIKGEDGAYHYHPSIFAEGEKKITTPLTVDSDGNILIGNFIWMRPTVSKNLIPEIVCVAAFFEEAITQYDNNLMISVHDLKNQENAILLAQKMNTMLKKVDRKNLCKEFVRIFPISLYEKWSEHPDSTFHTMMKAFNELKHRSISWWMNYNGHFLISEYMTLTAKHLLRIKDFDEFENLLTALKEPVNNYLTCKEEIMFARNKEKKVIRTKTDASKIFNVREKNTNIRVDPNLAMVIENVLIIHPEDFLRHTEEGVTDISNIIRKIKASFDTTEDILLQFGHVDFPILTSIFLSDAEQEAQYADNLKMFLQNTLNIKIEDSTKMFTLNDSLRIHPRSFFHLQNAKNVMAVLNQFDPKHLLLNEEKEFENRLENKIKKETGKSLHEHCLSKIREIFISYKDDVKCEAIKNQLHEQQDDIKSLCVNGHFIFKESMTYRILNKNGEVKLTEEVIVIVLNVASDMEETCKCKDMIDFTCLAFTINYYCKGLEDQGTKLIKTAEKEISPSMLLTSPEHYQRLMRFLMVQINKIKIYNKDQQFSFIELENWVNECDKYNTLEECLTDHRQRMERNFAVRLERIVSKERLEFEQPRRICLTMIGNIFWKNIDKIDFPGIEHIYLNSDEKQMHGIENLKIKSVKIFEEGVAYFWLKEGAKLKFDSNLFILALRYSASLDENLKCQNTFEFNSVLEIVNEYCQGAEIDDRGKLTKGKNLKKSEELISKTTQKPFFWPNSLQDIFESNKNEHLIKVLTDSETEYEKMVKFFEKEIKTIKVLHETNNYKYTFKTELKALHHWLKHGYDFNDVKHYFNEMNEFFSKTKEYTAEFNTQNGYNILRNYRNKQFFGSLVVQRQSDKTQKSIVATFYAQQAKSALIFTDIPIKFEHEIMKYDLKKTKKDSSFFSNLNKKLETTLKRMSEKKKEEAANVKGILILLQNSEDYDKNVATTMLEKLESVYGSAAIALCINSDKIDEKWLCLAMFLQNYNGDAQKFNPMFINKENETMEYIRYTANTGSNIGNEINLITMEDKTFSSFEEKIASMGEEQFDFSSAKEIFIMFDDTLTAEKKTSDFYERFKNILLRLAYTFINAKIVLCYKDDIIVSSMLQNLKDDTNNKMQFISVGNYIKFLITK